MMEQIKQRSLCRTFFGVSSIEEATVSTLKRGKKMLITISCALIGHIRNNVGDLIGAKNTKGKECCSNVSSCLWGGALCDDTKNGCEGDYWVALNITR